MSAIGTKQTSKSYRRMSLSEVKRAFIGPEGYVCFWPKADMRFLVLRRGSNQCCCSPLAE